MEKNSESSDLFTPTILWRGLKNASYLAVGHFFSMAISFIGFVYIARLLGPSDYGIYATVGAFVGMFDVITFYGINKVVLREGSKNVSRMHDYLERATGIKNFFTFIGIVTCIVVSNFMPYPLQVKLYIILFSFTLVYNSFNPFLETVYKAAEKMQYNAVLKIINSVTFVTLSITFLYFGFGLLALFIINLSTHFLTIIINYKLTKRFLIFKFWSKIKWDKYILKPAIIFSILSFTYLLAGKIDLLMISLLGSSKDVGIYGIAYQITAVGVTLRTLMANAFFPIFVKSFSKYVIKWRTLLKYSLLFGGGLLAIAVILSYFSGQIIPLLFGEKYFESAIIFSVLIFYMAFLFFDIPFTNTLQATYNELAILKISWIAPSVNIGLNYLFFNTFGLIGIAYSTLIVSSLSLIIYILLTWKILKNKERGNGKIKIIRTPYITPEIIAIPKVSVIITLFNKGPYIKRAIESVQNQTVKDFEIIVVNDGSTDNGPDIVKNIHDPRIRLISQNNQGGSSAANRGVQESKSDFITFLDGDDEWEPTHLETLLRLRERYPKAGAYSQAYLISTAGKKLIKNKYKHIPPPPWEGALPNYFKSELEGEHPVATGVVGIPKKIFLEFSGFDENAEWGPDLDLWSRVALKYPIVFSWIIGGIYHKEVPNRISSRIKPIHYHPLIINGKKAIKNNEVPLKFLNDFKEVIAKKEIQVAAINLLAGDVATAKKIIDQVDTTKFIFNKIKCKIYIKLPLFIYRYIHLYKFLLRPLNIIKV
jgi:O-antigen/teichoic acid export membrane protein/glycosyltransferase involved in cell wall biosynthesis